MANDIGLGPLKGGQSTGVDPGFPVGGAPTLWGGGGWGLVPTYKFAGFSQKLHEIKNILVHLGRAPALDPPLVYCSRLSTQPKLMARWSDQPVTDCAIIDGRNWKTLISHI